MAYICIILDSSDSHYVVVAVSLPHVVVVSRASATMAWPTIIPTVRPTTPMPSILKISRTHQSGNAASCYATSSQAKGSWAPCLEEGSTCRRRLGSSCRAQASRSPTAYMVKAPDEYKFQFKGGGWLHAVVDYLADGSCKVHIAVSNLPANVPCFLHWYGATKYCFERVCTVSLWKLNHAGVFLDTETVHQHSFYT